MVKTKYILRLGYPLFISSLAEKILATTDTWFLGHYSGAGLEAIAVSSIALDVATAFVMGFGKGAKNTIAADNVNNYKNSNKYFQQSLWLMLASSILWMCIFFIVINTPISKLLVSNESIRQEMISFLSIRIFSIPLIFSIYIFVEFLNGIKKNKFIIYVTFVMIISNIIANTFLVYGKFGFPELGIKGAAYGTLISEFVGLLIFVLFTKKLEVFKKFKFLKLKQIDKNLLSNSFPLSIRGLISIIGYFIFFALITRLGERASEVSAIIVRIVGFLFVFMYGFRNSISIIVSEMYSKKEFSKIPKAILKVIGVSWLFIMPLILISFVFPKNIISFFIDVNLKQGLVDDSIISLYLILIYCVFASAEFILIDALAAIRKTTLLKNIEIFATILYVSVGAIIVFTMPKATVEMMWALETLYAFALGVPAFFYFRHNLKKLKIEQKQ